MIPVYQDISRMICVFEMNQSCAVQIFTASKLFPLVSGNIDSFCRTRKPSPELTDTSLLQFAKPKSARVPQGFKTFLARAGKNSEHSTALHGMNLDIPIMAIGVSVTSFVRGPSASMIYCVDATLFVEDEVNYSLRGSRGIIHRIYLLSVRRIQI